MTGANGVRALLETRTKAYRPSSSAPAWAMGGIAGWGTLSLGEIERMRDDEQVDLGLRYRTAPLHSAEFEVEASSRSVQAYVEESLDRYKTKALPVGVESLPFGRCGGEALYAEERGLIRFDGLKFLHPADVRPFVFDGKLDSIRVSSGSGGGGSIVMGSKGGGTRLEAATPARPAKGLWFVHQAVRNPWYGRSCLHPAWFPWRVRNMPDGMREIIFKWCFKHSFSGMCLRHPKEMYGDAPGQPLVDAKDYANQLVNEAKAGANFTFPSDTDEHGNFKWLIENYGKPEGTAAGLLEVMQYWDRCILRGLGIPDEVLTHDGEGSFARSKVAAGAYYLQAEETLNATLDVFIDQVVRPSVRLNFGRRAWFRVKPKPLQPQEDQEGGGGAPPGGAPPEGQPQQPGGEAAGAPPAAPEPGGGGEQEDPLAALLQMSRGRGEEAEAAKVVLARLRPVELSADAQGHEHRGEGEGGGQFTGPGGGGESSGGGQDVRAVRKAERKAARQRFRADAHSVITAAFGDAVKGDGEEYVGTVHGRTVHVSVEPEEKMLFVEFSQPPAAGSAATRFTTTASELQPGTLDMAHKFRALVRGAAAKGLGISYAAAGEQRARVYERMLRSAGFERVSREGAAFHNWRPATRPVEMSTDAQGHEHKGAGEGGGQFTAGGDGNETAPAPDRKPSPQEHLDRAREHHDEAKGRAQEADDLAMSLPSLHDEQTGDVSGLASDLAQADSTKERRQLAHQLREKATILADHLAAQTPDDPDDVADHHETVATLHKIAAAAAGVEHFHAAGHAAHSEAKQEHARLKQEHVGRKEAHARQQGEKAQAREQAKRQRQEEHERRQAATAAVNKLRGAARKLNDKAGAHLDKATEAFNDYPGQTDDFQAAVGAELSDRIHALDSLVPTETSGNPAERQRDALAAQKECAAILDGLKAAHAKLGPDEWQEAKEIAASVKKVGAALGKAAETYGVVIDHLRQAREAGRAGGLEMSAAAPWEPYVGPRHGKGWRNPATGDVVYGGERPGGGTAASTAPPPKALRTRQTRQAEAKKAVAHLVAVGRDALRNLRHGAEDVGDVEHGVGAAVDAAIDRLPGKWPARVRGVLTLLVPTYAAAQHLVERVARERGATEEEARNLRSLFTRIDVTAAKPVALMAEASGVGLAVGLGVGLVPVGSACYLAYSGARNPVKTLRAAAGAVRDVVSRRREIAATVLSRGDAVDADAAEGGGELVGRVLDALRAHGNDERYVACLHLALDAVPDVGEALAAADEAYRALAGDDVPPTQLSVTDDDVQFYRLIHAELSRGADGG